MGSLLFADVQYQFLLIRAKYTDANFKRGVESNTYFLSKYFATKNIRFEIKVADAESNFGDEIINNARQIDADGILVMTTRDIGFCRLCAGTSGTIHYCKY